MRIIRASEIGTYLFCKRAWGYHNQGFESQNKTELTEGTAFHEDHGRQVLLAGFFRLAAWIALLVALILAAVWLTMQLL